MSSRWVCDMCRFGCILLTETGEPPEICPYRRSDYPEWERIDEDEEE